MASFAPIRGKQSEINNTPMVDGQFLIETDQGNQNKIYVDSYDDSTPPVLQRTMAGGGGHKILPTIDPTDPAYQTPITEDMVVEAVNDAFTDDSGTGHQTNENILSLYGVGHWTNVKTFRRTLKNATGAPATIGIRGVGTWDDSAVLIPANPVGTENPSSLGWYELNESTHLYQLTSDTTVQTKPAPATGFKDYWTNVPAGEVGSSDWWYDAAFVQQDDSDDIDISIKFDTSGDTIALGGYILDSTTGRICIKFANSITPSTAKIAVDVTHTRNEYS